MKLRVNEVFRSLQGEGGLTGTPAVFIRLQGCDVGCPWCDTAYASGLDAENRLADNDLTVFRKTEGSPAHTYADGSWLVREIAARTPPGRLAVITGGEPCLQDAGGLADALLTAGFAVQMETSGTRPIDCPARVWVTLSPKARPVVEANWARADEIKLPVHGMEDILRHEARLTALPPEKIRLQPVSQGERATGLCIRLCQERNWRLSVQMHKYLRLR